MSLCFGVKRGRTVTTFGARLEAAYDYWVNVHGSVLVYRASGTWGQSGGDRTVRWLRLKVV